MQARSQPFKKRGVRFWLVRGVIPHWSLYERVYLHIWRVGKLFQQPIILEKWVTIGPGCEPPWLRACNVRSYQSSLGRGKYSYRINIRTRYDLMIMGKFGSMKLSQMKIFRQCRPSAHVSSNFCDLQFRNVWQLSISSSLDIFGP